MKSSPFACNLLSYLHPRHRSSRARVFDAHSDIGVSPASHAFEAELAEKLQKLSTKNIASSELLSLSWLCQAMDVVISTQASMKQALCHGHTLSEANGHLEKMVKQCMEDSVKMLDVCRLLMETLAGARAYIKASLLALKRLQGLNLGKRGDVERAKHTLLLARRQMQEGVLIRDESLNASLAQLKATGFTKRLQACSSLLRSMGDKLPTPPAHCQSIHIGALSTGSTMTALYGGEICTIFFLRVLSKALSPTKGLCSSSSSITPLQLSKRPVWGPALLELQAQLNTGRSLRSMRRQVQRGRTSLLELYTLDDPLHRIVESLPEATASDQARKDVQDLVHSTSLLADHIQSSMARLHRQLDCISCSLLDIQMTLLDSHLTMKKE
ncbi:hypothetical protein L7F22_051161 [Adiantum nelumboides]|nr:hypothetical protein [Adiantum nelumboides]